jgi:hypothetical protein
MEAPLGIRGRRLALAASAAALLLAAGCENDDRSAPAFADEVRDSAALAEQAWRARFGDRVPRPDSVRALYVNGWAAGSRSRMAELIRIADETEINAFVIDIKESDTYLVYDSTGVELAREIGADQRPASKWLPELIDTLQAHRIHPIARIVAFKDRMLAEERPELAIHHVNGGVWVDKAGKPWVNPYHREVWDYNIAIAREALDMGFAEIQWDYVRFPDVTESQRRTMAFPASNGKTREDNIRDFIAYSRDELAEYRVPITADVFGLVTHMDGDVGLGQQWEKLIATADVVLPMVYPSHYYAGMYGFDRPHAHPYQVVRISMEDAVRRTRYVADAGGRVGEIMPWLEAMTATWLSPVIEYGPAQLRAQIQATYDAGLKSWTLWNPSSRYATFLPALRPADGGPSPLERGGWKPPTWEVPERRLSVVIRRKEAAERAARLAADSARADSARRAQAAAPPARSSSSP